MAVGVATAVVADATGAVAGVADESVELAELPESIDGIDVAAAEPIASAAMESATIAAGFSEEVNGLAARELAGDDRDCPGG